MNSMFAEPLESRQLFSAVGPATVFDSAVRGDELNLYRDFQKFNKDAVKFNSAMLKDAAHIKSQNITQAPSAKGDRSTFISALAPATRELKSDNLKESPTVIADEKAILAEQKKLVRDKNNSTAESADQAQLLTDRTTIQTDLNTLVQDRFTARENLYDTILSDASTLAGSFSSDTQESAKLTTYVTDLNTDANNASTTLSSDLETASTTATQLDTDLTASQSQQ